MNVRTSLLTGNLRIPRVGLGTGRLCGEGAEAAVRAALDAGYTHIDTARRYGNEAVIGKAIASAGVRRSSLFLTSKVWWTELEPANVLTSLARSLEDLGVEYLDLALIHWPNPAINLLDTLDAFAQAKARGWIRHFGVSNFPAALLERAFELSPIAISALQCEYHPFLDQTRLLELCRAMGTAFIAYAPFCSGAIFSNPTITRIAAKHGTASGAVTLQWLMQQPGVAAIPRSSNAGRIAANIQQDQFELEPEEMRAIHALRKPDGRLWSPDWAMRWDDLPFDAAAYGQTLEESV